MAGVKPSISENLSYAWEAVKQNIWILLGLYVGYMVFVYAISFIGAAIGNTAIMLLLNLVVMVIGLFFGLGFVQCCLNAVDKKEVSFEAFKNLNGYILSFFLANLMYALVVIIGCVFLILPGLWLSARLQFYPYFILEENEGPLGALQKSWNVTKGEDSYLLILILAWIVVAIVGLICLLVGIFVAGLVIALSQAYTYRVMREKFVEEVE